MKAKVPQIQIIDEKTAPTAQQIKRCEEMGTIDLSVSTGKTDNWDCLLRKAQGHPFVLIELGMMSVSKNFIIDSLYCEYGYIINLDTGMFEVYRGFQHKPHENGRYGKMEPIKYDSGCEYYPCALIAEFPLTNIPKSWALRCEKIEMESNAKHKETPDEDEARDINDEYRRICRKLRVPYSPLYVVPPQRTAKSKS